MARWQARGRTSALLAAILLAAAAATEARAAPIEDEIADARAAAGRCELAQAIAIEQHALGRARADWPPGHEGFFLLHHDLATWLNERFEFAAAEEQAGAAVEIARIRRGADSPLHALAMQNLGVALAGQRRYREADTLLRTAEAIFARTDAAESIAHLTNVQLSLVGLEFARGRSAAGLAAAERAAASVTRLRSEQAGLRMKAGVAIADARRRMLKLRSARTALAQAELDLAAISGAATGKRLLLVKAALAFEESRLAEALDLLDKAARLPPDRCDPLVEADIEARRGSVHMVQRQLPEAAAAFTQALAVLSRTNLRNNPREAEIVYGLAVIAGMSWKFDDASALFDKAAESFRRIHGEPTEAEALAYVEKAQMLGTAERGSQAVEAARRAMAILSGDVEQSPLAQTYAHAALGLALFGDRQFAGAQRELKVALSGFEAARGAASFDLAAGLDALGEMALASGSLRSAIAYFERAVSVQRRWGGASALALGISLSRLAAAQAASGHRTQALLNSAEAVAILRRRLQIGEGRPWNDAQAERIAARSIVTFDLSLVTAETRERQPLIDREVVERMLETAQLANATRTGAAIAQMTQRLGQLESRTGELLRERNDLSAEWQAAQDEVVGLLATDNARLADERRTLLLQRQSEVATRLVKLDALLVARDPKIDLIIKSKVVALGSVQQKLQPNEAALVIVTTGEGTYVVAVRRDRAAAYRAALSASETAASVDRLRSSLDKSRWQEDLPPFDTEAAYRLFQNLLEPAIPFLRSADSLLVVTDGALSTLPLAVLLTAPSPAVDGVPEDYIGLPWLIRRFAVSTYPSVASIVTLRELQRRTGLQARFLGVGAPLFTGSTAIDDTAGTLLQARSGSSLADVASLRALAPLPGAREELTGIADAFGVSRSKLLLGPDASELRLRGENLEDYSVILFATHGLIAGRLRGYAEPALVLTPPHQASSQDDGLLNASEVALLRLRADWVILSACNTAGGDEGADAEPLSGLAKAFFYAGTRSLLVTHWAVASRAAMKLTTETVRRTEAGEPPAMSLRAAALGFINDDDRTLRTHPYFWAPFALVGG